MTVLFVLLGLAVAGGVALAAVGRLGDLPPAGPDHRPDGLPATGPLQAADLAAVRFDVVVRGYRMDEVDDLLDRLAADLTARDVSIEELQARLGADWRATEPAPAEPAPTEPVPAEPAPTEPVPAEPAATQPTEPQPGEREPAEREPAEREPAGQGPAEREPAGP